MSRKKKAEVSPSVQRIKKKLMAYGYKLKKEQNSGGTTILWFTNGAVVQVTGKGQLLYQGKRVSETKAILAPAERLADKEENDNMDIVLDTLKRPMDMKGEQDIEDLLEPANVPIVAKPAVLKEFPKTGLTDRQLTAAKKVYDACIWFLMEFRETNGFNDYFDDYEAKGHEDPENDALKRVDRKLNEISLCLLQEHFDLGNSDLYTEFGEFIDCDLVFMYDGKMTKNYRKMALNNGNLTTKQDYAFTMAKLNNIIERYVWRTK